MRCLLVDGPVPICDAAGGISSLSCFHHQRIELIFQEEALPSREDHNANARNRSGFLDQLMKTGDRDARGDLWGAMEAAMVARGGALMGGNQGQRMRSDVQELFPRKRMRLRQRLLRPPLPHLSQQLRSRKLRH